MEQNNVTAKAEDECIKFISLLYLIYIAKVEQIDPNKSAEYGQSDKESSISGGKINFKNKNTNIN